MSNLITELTPNDVILGRGLGPSQSAGNKQFLRIVRSHKAQYKEVGRDGKDTIAAAIVDHIRKTLGGRFVKEVDSKIQTNRVWREVDIEAALVKTKQALRDRRNETASAKEKNNDVTGSDMQHQARDPSPTVASSLHPNLLSSLSSQALPGVAMPGVAMPGVAAAPSAGGVAVLPVNNVYVPQASHVPQQYAFQREHPSNISVALQASPSMRAAVLPVNNNLFQQQGANQQQGVIQQQAHMQSHSLPSLHGNLSIASQVVPAVGMAVIPVNNVVLSQPLFLTSAGAPAFNSDLATLQSQMTVNPGIETSLQHLGRASPNTTTAPASVACYPPQDIDDFQVKPAALHPPQYFDDSELKPAALRPPQSSQATAELSKNYVNHLIKTFKDQEMPSENMTSCQKRHIDLEDDNVFSSDKSDSTDTTDASSSCDRKPESAENIDESSAIDFLWSAFMEDSPKFTLQEEKEERARLTAEQQAAAIADMFGNLCNISRSTKRLKRPMSDPQSVDSLLEQMRLEISNIPVAKKLPLIVAQEKGSPREFNDERLGLFLHREDMDASAAARRFVFYWEKRLEAFGPDKFYLPITQSGALRDDSDALQSGYMGLLPNLDASGRQIFYVVPRLNSFDGYTEESVLRLRWYMFETASQHASAREGLVMLIHMKGATIWNFQRNSKRAASLLELEREAWPVKCIATHVCQSPSVVQEYIRPIMLAKMDQRLRSRLVHHDAEGRALVEALARYGISEDVLPQEMGGKFEHDHAKWLASRRQAEEVEDLLLINYQRLRSLVA